MAKVKSQLVSSLVLKLCYSLFFFALASAAFHDDQPYCALRYRRLCQGKGRHVACQYPNANSENTEAKYLDKYTFKGEHVKAKQAREPGPGASCHNYTRIKFTPELRHFIINYINKRRQRIAAGTERVRGGALIPKPQIMMMVVWDRELAYLAQRLADQCTFVHDDCRATVRYPFAGQTVGEVRWRGSGESDTLSAQRAMRRVFDAWWGERRRVTPEQLVTPFRLGTKGSAWGHFSQLAVWALVAAGCGAARHGSPRRLLLVCDFSHTNMLGQSTLMRGELSPCPARSVRRGRSSYPLLCAPMKKPHGSDDDNEDESSYDEGSTDFLYDDDVSTLKNTEETQGMLWIKSGGRSNEVLEYNSKIEDSRVRQFKNTTEPYNVMHRLEQELVIRSTIPENVHRNYQKTYTTRMYFGEIRESHENDFVSKARFKIHSGEPYYQIAEDVTTEITRRKWKQTRQRPRRPGAAALISKRFEKILRRSSIASITLDREDMEQLFQDTGFHKHWKKQSFP